MKADIARVLRTDYERTFPFQEEPVGVKNRLQTVHALLSATPFPADACGACLLIADDRDPQWHPLGGKTRVGRSSQADIQVAGTGVSRLHCSIRDDQGDWLIEDLDSKNGLYVNGRSAVKRGLGSGDLIEFGTVVAVFIIA